MQKLFRTAEMAGQPSETLRVSQKAKPMSNGGRREAVRLVIFALLRKRAAATTSF
jgi:hypothetical protein